MSKVGDFLDERIGHRQRLRAWLDTPIAGGARWAYVFGTTLTLLFVLQAVTGIVLMTGYAPSAQSAWASVVWLQSATRGGWLVRGLHAFGTQAIILVLGAHLLQVALYGAYKRPREITWWTGLLLLALTLTFALTGNPLRWDQRGYWAMRVETGIAGGVPVIGSRLQSFLLGGDDYGSLTLTRFHALHVAVLPIALGLLFLLHRALAKKQGPTPPATADQAKTEPTVKQLARDLAFALFVLVVVFACTLKEHGAPIDAPADAASDYVARPEWYFAALFELRKHFHGSAEMVGTLVLPGLAGAYLFALPFFDKKASRALRPRLPVLTPLFVGVISVVLLTYMSSRADARDPGLAKARARQTKRAAVAVRLAERGVPASGPLVMLANDPELRGESIFRDKCASCHVLGELGDRAKNSAPVLDGWGTAAWARSMLHNPDDDARFGKTAYAGEMPSMDTPSKDKPDMKPMPKTEIDAVVAFLASEGTGTPSTNPAVAAGEKIVKDRCTSCHLYQGEGDDADEGIAPELSGWGSRAWIAAQVANPATKATYRENALDPKRKGHMPRMDRELSPADIALVADWTYAHARNPNGSAPREPNP
ncbi:MAG: cytochrome b N-terminal domain-containing protein [Polyangiaceae bacterium]